MIGKYNNMKKLFISLLAIIASVGNVFSQSMIISGGNDHGLALCSKGQIFAWGYNAGNRLCLSDPTDAAKDIVPSPSLVNTGNLTFSQVSGGSGGHSVALSCNKVVYCWGDNNTMQCGRPKSNYIEGGEPVPVYKGVTEGYDLDGNPGGDYLGNVKYISATSAASMAILDDGTGRVVMWGGNVEGSGGGGGVIETPTYEPIWIIDQATNKPIENVIHITGGDNNIMLIVGDSPDAKVGTVYTIGNWNGRGGDGDAKSFIAAPVEIGDGTGAKSSGKYLTNVRTSGLSDTGGFAVDGETGYVYGWGNGGWWGACGLRNAYSSSIVYAEKVTSGEYKDISGEAYLTDAIQVIGGNGNGTVVTKEGHVLYWGHNGASDPTTTSGGVIPNSKYDSKTESTANIGPVFANYCETKDAQGKTIPEHRVEDAVAIARGDLYGFMVNQEGDFYVWGSTARPTTEALKHVGALGTGKVEEISTCFKKIEILCDPQDLCPEAFMLPKTYKCPGTIKELYSGFTPLKNSEENYFYQWTKDGKILNNAKPTDDKNTRKNDKYNKESIDVSEPGLYRVDIYYVGLNVPCENCPEAFAECEVIDMEMPIDTILTQACVDTFAPKATDEVCFEFKVNNKFYQKGATTWRAYDSETSETAIDTIEVEVGDKGVICVTGDNVSVNKEDTIYSIFIEDYTKMQGTFFEKGATTTGKSGQLSETQPFYLYVTVYSDVILESAKLSVAIGWDGGNYTLTPSIYKAGTDVNGKPIADKKVKDGKPIPFSIPDCKDDKTLEGVIKEIELNFGELRLEGNSARGASYFIFFNASKSINSTSIFTDLGPFSDDFGGNSIIVHEVGQANNLSNFSPNGSHAIYDLVYSKMTSYTCGRIELQSKFWCPPCDDPKKLEITASETIKDDVDAEYKKVVELCKESDDLVLNIEPLEGKNDPTAKFDIFWFDKFKADEADALIKDITGSATTLETKTNWATVAGAADIDKDVEKVYYVMVYDHKNPEKCEHYDSIKVIAHPAPVDSLDWIEFCEGELTAEPTFEITGKTINWIDEPKDVAILTGPTGTGTKEYTYKYTVTDDKTGCEGEEHTLTISVNKTGEPKVTKNSITLLKDPSVKFQLSVAVPNTDPDCEIHWYESETATSEMTNTSIALDEAKTIEVWAEQYNTKTGCTSKRIKVEIVINDAPKPEVTDESLCIGDEIVLSDYVEAKEDHTLNWYDDPSAAKGTGSQTAPSFKATAAGTYKFYVSQTNTKTGAESEKATLTITVHEVATLELIANKTEYCINEPAVELTFTANSDGDFTTAKWSKKSDMSDATATLTPTTDEKGDVVYYAQAEYTNKDAQKKFASTVCYGKIQDITITTNMTDIPNSKTNYTVQYLHIDGEKNKSYKSLLDQDGTAVIVEPGHSLKWYDSDKKPLNSEPAPEYVANETGERKVIYYVSQVNQTTGCESELHDVTAIISSFPSPKVKALSFCQGTDELKSSYPLTATINTDGGFSEGSYQLIWYKQDPKANPGAEEFIAIDLSMEDLSYDATTVTAKDFKYWVVQRYLGPGGGQSPASDLLVTIYSKPILKTKTPDPICLGEEVDLKDLYSISNTMSSHANYEHEYLGENGSLINTSKVSKHGSYMIRSWFILSSGDECSSEFEEVNVTVQELDVAIKGDNTTCPGIGVELTAVLDTANMGANDVPSYSWSVSPTGVTGQMETLNTSAEGLSKKGDKLTVNLEVSMGACKGKKPVDAYIVTVDDPGVDGTIKFDEQYNTNSGQGAYTLSKDGIIEFDGCNSKVEVAFNVKQTEDEFTYENLETGVVKKDSFNNGEGKFDIKAGLYEVTFTNSCKTSFKFEVKDKSLDITGYPSNMAVCEGTPLTIKIVNYDNTPFEYDPKKYKIEWQKDGNTLPNYNSEVLYIPSTTPDDNGVYSYTVTSSGCVYHDKIAYGVSFKSKPKVKINESLLAKDGVYEVIRTKSIDITIPIVQSTGIDMSNLNDKIIWKEDGVEVNRGETLSLTNVVSDHEYQIVIANGEKGTNTDYCGTNLNITLNVDALLSINAVLVDGTGKQTKDMCVNEEGVGFQIDTTGTGKVLHPDKFTLKVVETLDGKEKEIALAKKDDYLFAEISPNKSATYDIVYKYSVGNQDSSKKAAITVHPAYNVDWDRNVRLCEGETGFIQITKAEPASEIELTWESDECLKSGSKSGANVEAVFSGSGLTSKKALTLVASNGGICADKKYYPEFTIDKAIEGNIIAPEFVCEGHNATLDASPYKATEYVWSSISQFGEGVTKSGASINVASKSGYATYTVEMQRGACTETADVTIDVRPAPKFDRIDSLSFRSVEIVLQTNTGTAPFQYIVDDNYDDNVLEPVKDSLEYGTHNIKVLDAAGCEIDSSFVTNAPGLEIPIHISPNGDAINDAFSIPTLREAYPEANIRIYDRWGKKLADYKAGNSEFDWDGTYNGIQMQSTDYWYEIEIKEIKKTYTGHFTLIRQ